MEINRKSNITIQLEDRSGVAKSVDLVTPIITLIEMDSHRHDINLKSLIDLEDV